MNMTLMNEYIEYFNSEIIESGFKRDIDDYVASLPSHQTNIITLREIANLVLGKLDDIYESDLPDSLQILIPENTHSPFTSTPHFSNMKELIDNVEIELPVFLVNCIVS